MTKGYSTIKVSYIGENMVLLAWEEEDNLSDIFEGEEEWLASMFKYVSPWSPEVS